MRNGRYRVMFGSVIVMCGLFAGGCGTPLTPEEVVRAHVEALNREDIDAAMSHVEQGPNYEITRMTNEGIFKTYDIRYTVESVELYDRSRDEVKLRVTQTTVKHAGPIFVNNRMTAIWTLKSNWRGTWRIASTERKTMEQL